MRSYETTVPCRCGDLHRLERKIGRRLRERREDAAAVEPAGAVPAEDLLPVDVARAQLRGRRVATVGDADRAANAEAALGEVQPVAHLAPDAVVGDPAEVGSLDATLVDEVVDQPADGIVGERRHDRRAEPEAAFEAAGDVVLAASLPRLEGAGRLDPPLTRVEAQHDLAERDEVEAALRGTAQGQQPTHRLLTSRASRSISSNRPPRTTSGRTSQLPPHATTDGTAR